MQLIQLEDWLDCKVQNRLTTCLGDWGALVLFHVASHPLVH